MSRSRLALSWSSGKDSAWTLHRLRQDPGIEVVALVTTVNEAFNRGKCGLAQRGIVSKIREDCSLTRMHRMFIVMPVG